jgi:glycosyltransferase involved in cell wall biosynthesis
MRILHTVEFYYPRIGGAEAVVRQLSERLAARGHKVTVATSIDINRKSNVINNVKIQGFNIKGNLVKGIRGEVQHYFDFLLQNNWDVVFNYATQSWTTDLAFSILRNLQSVKVLAPCGYSGLIGLRRFLYYRYFKKLPHYLRLYDEIVYHSPNYIDKEYGDRMGIDNYEIIPNGVELEEFENSCLDFRSEYNIHTPFLLLTVGNHYRIKGHDRIIKAFHKLHRADVTLVIIGSRVNKWYRSCWVSCKSAAKKGIYFYLGLMWKHSPW